PASAASGPAIVGIPIEFLLFAVVLAMVAFGRVSTMLAALAGALLITLYKVALSPYAEGAGLAGLLAHAGTEWVGMANLLALLLGFALLARHFEDSQIPARLPDYLPDNWTGP